MSNQLDPMCQIIEKKNDRTNWPLKLINKEQNSFQHSCMFNFLCTKSLFWVSLLKLENYGAIFRLSKSSFSPIFQSRFDNASSYMSNKCDTFNTLNLSPLEYYFVFFFMLVHDTRTQSRKVFNTHTSYIEIDSVHGDLLCDYLNYFLPLSKQEFDFPSCDQIEQQQYPTAIHFQKMNETPKLHKYDYVEHRSLFKKCFKKSCLTQLEDELIPTKVSLDRTNTIKKIDSFVRLMNEILVYPFTDQSKVENFDLNSSTIRYNENMQNLTNLECVFTLSLVIRHSHYFSNAFNLIEENTTTLGELRALIFKVYWRRSFYKFFKYNLEHWPFESNIKWLVELWLNYIEPEQLISYEFINDNYLIVCGIYQIILKRFSNVDLTNCQNSSLLIEILRKFVSNKPNIKSCDDKFFRIKFYQWTEHLASKLSKQDLIRQNLEFKLVFNLFEELDESIRTYSTLNDKEHKKLVGYLYTLLSNAKLMLNDEKTRQTKSTNTLQWIRSLFAEEIDSQFGKMSQQDIYKSIENIDNCLELIRYFYEDKINFEDFDTKEELVSADLDQTNDYESIDDRKIRLTPKGRYKVINRIRKANVELVYDPETASVGDFENRFLVYVCQFVSDFFNENFCQFIEKAYGRTDILGKLSKKCFHLSKRDDFKPRVNLRHLASYKFLLYFFAYLLLLNLITGYSFVFLAPSILFLYFAYNIIF